MLSERSEIPFPPKEYMLCDSFYVKLQKMKMILYCQKADQWLFGDKIGRGGKEALQRGMKKLFRVMGMFAILIVVMVSCLYTYVKTYQTVYFKYVWFEVCQLYLNKAIK